MTPERSYTARVPSSARLVRVPLEMDLSPAAVLRAAGADPAPFALFGAWADGRALVGSDPVEVVKGAADPFSLLDEQPSVSETVPGAVGGGWVGYLGYGLGRLIERLPVPPPRPVPLPSSVLGFYDHLLVRDNSGQWWFEALWSNEQSGRLESRLSVWRRRAAERESAPASYSCGMFRPNPAPESHLVAVARAIEHIRSGDVFQVNVCTRLEAAFRGESLELFCRGAGLLEPRYGAYLGQGAMSVASFSPELFLKRRGRHVLSSPIKGTARSEDHLLGQRDGLLGSEKDRAENLMIVDLVRNDLGRVCRYGSVEAPALFRAEEHPGLWHLVSDVTGELGEAVSDGELLRACFPPGSVTGAPKVRAMELISLLEGTARELYTGAIGIASPVNGLELNVAIRTFEMSGTRAWLGVGGGVVADSEPNCELEECYDKARPLLAAIGAELAIMPKRGPAKLSGGEDRLDSPHPGRQASTDVADLGVFETMLVLDNRPIALESHLGRLSASLSSLYGSPIPSSLGSEVLAASLNGEGPQRLRVHGRVTKDGEVAFQVTQAPAPEAFNGRPEPAVALVPSVWPGGLGWHKWHDRRPVSHRRDLLGLTEGEQVLFLDADEMVLESEHANVFAVFRGVLRTAPLDGRILAGTTRAAVIRLATTASLELSEEPLRLAELAAAEEIFVTSSVRGLLAVGELGRDRSFKPGPVTTELAAALWSSWHNPGASRPTESERAQCSHTP
jgi:para-aminobenzoate synthetase/4-amino-4-deoxychorismate lyase